MLLPEGEVETVLGVTFLPSKLRVLRQLAGWHVLHRVVLVENLTVSLCTPIVVHAERLGIAQRYGLLTETEIGEVVFETVRCEEILRDLAGEISIILTLPLSFTSLWQHDEHVSLRFVRGHYAKRQLNFLKICSRI